MCIIVNFLLPKINLIAPPQYVMTTTTLDRNEGIARLSAAIQMIRETIEENEGQFNLKMEVCVPFKVVFKLLGFPLTHPTHSQRL